MYLEDDFEDIDITSNDYSLIFQRIRCNNEYAFIRLFILSFLGSSTLRNVSEMEAEQVYGADAAIPSPFTKQVYRLAFRRFLQYLDMEGKQAALLQQDRKVIESQIIGYIHFLSETKKYGRDSLRPLLAAIFHFYEMNDILLNKNKITRFMPQDDSFINSDKSVTNSDRAYTHEEIEQILESLDYRVEVIILLMASTGMRLGALVGLKIGHLTKI